MTLPHTIELREEAFNNLSQARMSAERDANGMIYGYDNLVGRIMQAEILVQDGRSFPELDWAITEARYFLYPAVDKE